MMVCRAIAVIVILAGSCAPASLSHPTVTAGVQMLTDTVPFRGAAGERKRCCTVHGKIAESITTRGTH